MPQSITLRTIGDFLDYEHRLSGFCNGCRRYIELDLEALARRFGRDFDTDGIRPRLRCSACGSRDCSVVVHGPTPARPYAHPTPRTTVKPVRQPRAMAWRRYPVRAMDALANKDG